MKSCSTCSHWKSNRFPNWKKEIESITPGFFDYGVCSGIHIVDVGKMVYDKPALVNYNGYGCCVETRKDFFCNLWKGKVN